MYVLAEGGYCGQLTDEVEVRASERVDSTAVEHGHGLLRGQCQVLHTHTHTHR